MMTDLGRMTPSPSCSLCTNHTKVYPYRVSQSLWRKSMTRFTRTCFHPWPCIFRYFFLSIFGQSFLRSKTYHISVQFFISLQYWSVFSTYIPTLELTKYSYYFYHLMNICHHFLHTFLPIIYTKPFLLTCYLFLHLQTYQNYPITIRHHFLHTFLRLYPPYLLSSLILHFRSYENYSRVNFFQIHSFLKHFRTYLLSYTFHIK